MTRILLALAFTTFALVHANADALTERLKFWDDGPQDASFVKFRNELKAIIARKDASALFKHLASNIKLDFGGSSGGSQFNKMWNPNDKESEVWAALSLVVEQGGNFDSSLRFSAPYVYGAFPSDLDAFEFVVATSESAVMRAAPNSKASVVRRLDRDILTLIKSSGKTQHEAGPNDWDEVKDAKGKHGFVLARDVRSPIDYRAYFEKRKGR